MAEHTYPTVKLELGLDDFGTLCICALRYCQGRQTYMPGLVRSIVRPLLPRFSDKDIAVMLDDCEYQRRFDLYGSETIDKPGWLEWKNVLEQEKERRESEKGVCK